MRNALIVLGLLVGSAAAKPVPRPTTEQAKQTAEAWLEAANLGGDPAVSPEEGKAVLRLTRLPLFVIAYEDGPDGGCKPTTVKTPFALATVISCVRKVIRAAAVQPWSKEDAKQLPRPLRAYRGKLAALEKTATIVHQHEQCAGQGSDLVMAVALDKDTPKVVAVYWQTIFCGE